MKTLDTLFVYDRETAYAMQSWFERYCVFSGRHRETAEALWQSWTSFAITEDHYLSTKKKLGMFLRFQNLQSYRMSSGTRSAWGGISLRQHPAATAHMSSFLRDAQGGFVTNARSLHKTLGVKTDFSTWIKTRIEQYRFQADRDYLRRQTPPPSRLVEYQLTLDMTVELCRIEGTNTGLAMHSQLQDYRDQQHQKLTTLGVTP